MSRVCTICSHAERAQIDAALLAGMPIRSIAFQIGVSHTAIQRHKAHVSETISKSQEARDEAQALDVVKQLKAINGAAREILSSARHAGNPDLALRAIDRIHKQLELQAKLLGDLDDRPQINVLLGDPQWLAIFAAIRGALLPFAGAMEAVDEAVAALEERVS